MKLTITLLACCCILLFPVSKTRSETSVPSLSSPLTPSDHGGKIETKYDGFNWETVVTLKKMGVSCGGAKGLQSAITKTCVSIAVSLHCPGVQLDHVRFVKLQLFFESKQWDERHSPDQRELIVVANEERLKLGKMALARQGVETSQLIDVMREVLEVSIPFKTFQKIALADNVEMKVGKSMFSLQKKNILALRDLNNRISY
jgi:hypothetical protein